MSDETLTMPDVIDWEDLILEAQTAPCGVADSVAFGQIYRELNGYVDLQSIKWLNTHQLSEAHDGAFSAVAWELITKNIHKFKMPANSIDICASFKAWIGKCCSREWEHRKHEIMDSTKDDAAIDHLRQTLPSTSPSLEEILCADNDVCTNTADLELKKNILNEELNKLPESMRDAILETTDLKDISNLNSRGKQGEAARIALKYSYKLNAIRTSTHRLRQKVKARYEREGGL